MDPNIGKFYEIDDNPKAKKGTMTTFEAKAKKWPIFEIGETVMLKGFPFEVVHIKHAAGRMILKPVLREAP